MVPGRDRCSRSCLRVRPVLGLGGCSRATSVALFHEPGDYVGEGLSRTYDSGNASFEVTGSANYLDVWVTAAGSPSKYWQLTFAGPDSDPLAPGVYAGAKRAYFRGPGTPGIDIGGNGSGCNKIDGWFQVKDLEVGSDGVPNRLWIVYEQHCEGRRPALFGEIRIGVPPGSHCAGDAVRRQVADGLFRPSLGPRCP